jgi:hypothetical protein
MMSIMADFQKKAWSVFEKESASTFPLSSNPQSSILVMTLAGVGDQGTMV